MGTANSSIPPQERDSTELSSDESVEILGTEDTDVQEVHAAQLLVSEDDRDEIAVPPEFLYSGDELTQQAILGVDIRYFSSRHDETAPGVDQTRYEHLTDGSDD